MNEINKHENIGFEELVQLFEQTQEAMQTQASRSVDIALVVRNWFFGWYIVEYQQGGTDRAEYGKQLLNKLSERLTEKMGKGFSVDNLELMRKFYTGYSKIKHVMPVKSLDIPISETLSRISAKNSETSSRKTNRGNFLSKKTWESLFSEFSLSWSHYVVLLTIKSEEERRFYEVEALENAWGIRELKRQINSSLYERLALSRDKKKVKELSEKGQLIRKPSDVLRASCSIHKHRLNKLLYCVRHSKSARSLVHFT